MIGVIRRLLIISLLFSIILLIQSISVHNISDAEPRLLVALGFSILASFTLGEILAIIGLPRVIGYLLIGIIFGPYSAELLGIDLLTVFNKRLITELSLINIITVSLIAISAGMELKIKSLRNSIKFISVVLLLKTVIIFAFVTGTVILLSHFIPFLSGASFNTILAAGLLISVISMGTSIELTMVVAGESDSKGHFIDTILGTAIVKDILVILLFAVVLSVSIGMLNPSASGNENVMAALALELLFSVIAGAILGFLVVLYLKHVRKELLLFILGFVVIGAELSSVLHLETLIVFVVAGFIVQNFSPHESEFHHQLQKLSLPIFIVFFTLAGAAINITTVISAAIIGVIIFAVRGLALYLSVKNASKLTGEKSPIKDYGWLGFFSIGGLMLGFAIVIEAKLPGFGADLKTIITSLVALNIFIGPVLLKFALAKSAAASEIRPTPKEPEAAKVQEPIKPLRSAAFHTPGNEDDVLRRSMFDILLKLNDIISDFKRKFIVRRTEESLELIISITEYYVDNHIKLKSGAVSAKTPRELMNNLLQTKKEFSDVFLNLCKERKITEKQILELEPLIKDLFYSLNDLSDELPREFKVKLEKKFYELSHQDSYLVRMRKLVLRSKLTIRGLLRKEKVLYRKIEYRNLAKYYLVGESSGELLETVSLVGAERLSTFRQIRKLFNDYNENLDKIFLFLSENKNPETLFGDYTKMIEDLHSEFTGELQALQNSIAVTTDELNNRLQYALAVPFNQLLDKLDTAGTYMSVNVSSGYSSIFTKSEKAREETLSTIRYWLNYYLGFLGILSKEVIFRQIKTELYLKISLSLLTHSDNIHKKIEQAKASIHDGIETFINGLVKTGENDAAALEVYYSDSLNECFLKRINIYANELEEYERLIISSSALENLLSKIVSMLKEQPESIELIEESQMQLKNRLPVYLPLKSINLRKTLASFFEHKLPREIAESHQMITDNLSSAVSELKNLTVIVSYHFRAAQKELDSTHAGIAQSLNIASGLADKIRFRAEQMETQSDMLVKTIQLRIRDNIGNIVNQINELIVLSSVRKSDFLTEADEGKRKALEIVHDTYFLLFGKIRSGLSAVNSFYQKYFRSLLNDSLIRYGLIVPPKSKEGKKSLFSNSDVLETLPIVYKRLFDASPIETTDILTHSKSFEPFIEEVYAEYQKGEPIAAVFIGEPGSGKQSLIRSLKTNLSAKSEILYLEITQTITDNDSLSSFLSSSFGFERVMSIEELTILLKEDFHSKVCIVDNISKLFLKKVGKYQALQSMLNIISETSSNILWIFSANRHVWTFLNSYFDISRVFQKQFYSTKILEHEIRHIALNRHNATGNNLVFLPDEFSVIKSKILRTKSVKDFEIENKENFFHHLEKFAGGNISAGIFYWLISIVKAENSTIYLKPKLNNRFELIAELEDIYLLSLVEILIHDNLSIHELSLVFGAHPARCREIIRRLMSLGLITKKAGTIGEERFTINKLFYKPVFLELNRRNFLS